MVTKNLGAVYTPKEYAKILSTWAIQSKTDTILDMGIGMGVFVFQAFERLKELGAENSAALNQIYGSEIDKNVFKAFKQEAKIKGGIFQNLRNDNFFDYSYPEVDVIVGNPPYVRRRKMDKEDVNYFREKTVQSNSVIDEKELFALTDLYIYFLLMALPSLVPGGRLATIVADTWLNARYGNIFKKYLVSEFNIAQIISLDRRVFQDTQVKAVIILASKKECGNNPRISTRFSRIRNGLPLEDFSSFVLNNLVSKKEDILVKDIDVTSLAFKSPWGEIFKSSTLIEDIRKKPIIKPFKEVAKVQIGLQTLAKNFFVITEKEKKEDVVEEKYLVPFACSVSNFDKPIIEEDDEIQNYVFYCSSSKKGLKNTKALAYILEGENKEVIIRGKGTSVIGYQNKKRIKDANRPFWYDVKSEIDKKAIAEIFLPRFIYKDYFVLWNAAKYVPGGAIVQYIPHDHKPINIRVSLAILTSSFSEIVFRINAQIYGGGTSNLRITDIKNAPTIDIFQLTSSQQAKLVNAYEEFIKTGGKDNIDKVVNDILELDDENIKSLENLLQDLISMATSARKAAHPPY